jgi:hypothetical protein
MPEGGEENHKGVSGCVSNQILNTSQMCCHLKLNCWMPDVNGNFRKYFYMLVES